MKKLLLLVAAAIFTTWLYADDTDFSYSPSRPGMVWSTNTLGAKRVEGGLGFSGGHADGTMKVAMPSVFFRLGIANYADFGIIYNGYLAKGEEKWGYDFAPLMFYSKVRIFNGYNTWAPKIALIAALSVPTTTEMAQTMHVAPSITASFSHSINSWFSFFYNVGAEWDGTSPTPSTFVAISIWFALTPNFGMYVENYNYITGYGKNLAGKVNFNGGFYYLVHPRVQLDLYTDFNCQDPSSKASVGAGICWLIH